MYGFHIFMVHISQLMLSSSCDTSWRVFAESPLSGEIKVRGGRTSIFLILLAVIDAFSCLFSSTTRAKSRPITSLL